MNLCLIFDTVYFESGGGTYPFLTLSRYSAPRTAFFVVLKIFPTLLALKLCAIKYLASLNCESVHFICGPGLAMFVSLPVSLIPSLMPSPAADRAAIVLAQVIEIIFNPLDHICTPAAV